MKKTVFLALLAALAVSAFAQTREPVRVCVTEACPPAFPAPSLSLDLRQQRSYAEPLSLDVSAGDRAVRLALAALGRVNYVFGADPNSIPSDFRGGTTDCSGFVQKVMQSSYRTRLPRTAEEQYAATAPVIDPRPGDLVFFKNTYRRGISHVGIYVDNCRFIHNSQPRVKWGTLCSGRLRRDGPHFAGIRRVRESG